MVKIDFFLFYKLMASDRESPKVAGFKYLMSMFTNYDEDTQRISDIYLITDSDIISSLYFAYGSFENNTQGDSNCKKLTINPKYKDKFTPEFLSIYLTIYANHYITQISYMLAYIMPHRNTNDHLFNFYQQIDIICFSIEKQMLIVKTYNTIISVDVSD